ncbi:hypothetical protein BALAC2494_02047 [Bifidobacterium animalis subsp. lactis CNCM I-2494]|uniref:Uncharacterized protein n=1 Tax=Bifidobacterium animalis subsp. lactis CNCM I-2494 TaxID=1042403 RepID=A0A806FIV4_BIFAN|nr:hypothetical protein BALAC2494_02047 [Bifidobacterium animalis subsp. lactis CNCM I-2494]
MPILPALLDFKPPLARRKPLELLANDYVSH